MVVEIQNQGYGEKIEAKKCVYKNCNMVSVVEYQISL